MAFVVKLTHNITPDPLVIELSTFPDSYLVQDIGNQNEPLKFANDGTIYTWGKGYNPAYKTIRFSGKDELAVLNNVESLVQVGLDGDTISFEDMYGRSYSTIYVKSFNFTAIKATQVGSFEIELVVMVDAANVFIIGGSKTYGIESCSISEKINETEIIDMTKVAIKTYQSKLYDISVSGIELLSGIDGALTGTLTNTIFDFTAPNGKTYKALILNTNITSINGVAGFQRFSFTMIASDVAITFEIPSGGIIESWNVVDASARINYIRVIEGAVLQISPPKKKLDINFTVYTDDVDEYDNGEAGSVTLDQAYSGYVTSKSYSEVEGNGGIYKLNIGLIVIGI